MAATGISFENFEEYKRTSAGARRVQERTEEFIKRATQNGTDVLAELKKEGFNDLNALTKTCEQFSFYCWPIDLGELGSGLVLYFHFIRMLVVMMLCFAVVQLPAISEYMSAGDSWNQCGWPLLTHWTEAYERDTVIHPREIPPCTDSVGSYYFGPGNFGPCQAEEAVWIPTTYLVILGILCGLVFIMYVLARITDEQVDADTVSPNDFAAMVSGLPVTATDERSLTLWFSLNAVQGREVEIVKVVIGWDAGEFREKRRRLVQLSKQLKGLDDQTGDQAAQIQEEMKQITNSLDSVAQTGAANLRSSGTVVVVFRHQQDMRAFISRFQGFWHYFFYADSKDCCCAGNGLFMGPPLPRFPLSDRPVFKLLVQRAPNPGDINWEDLGVDWWVKKKKLMETNFIMFVWIVISFVIIYFCEQLKVEGESNRALTILPSFVTIAIQFVMTFAAKNLAEKEYHDSFTEQEFSQASKMTIGMIVNTAGVIGFINANVKGWYQVGGLVDSLTPLLLTHSFLPPLLLLLDPSYKIKGLKRRKLTQEKIDRFNAVLSRGPPKSAAEAKEHKQVLAEIEFFKAAYKPSEMLMARRYANTLKVFLCNLFYMPLIPACAFIGVGGLALQYAVDKYLVTSWYSRCDRPQNSSLAGFSVHFLKLLAPISFVVAIYAFLTPSWKGEAKGEVWSVTVLGAAVAGIFSLVFPLDVWAEAAVRFFRLVQEDNPLSDVDYYKAQHMWSPEMKYHKDQFIYKMLPASKNPEMLSEGVSSALDSVEAKAVYGAATKEAGAARYQPGRVALRGGRVIPGRSSTSASIGGAKDEEAGGGEPDRAPTTYGLAIGSDDDERPPTPPAVDPAPEEPATSVVPGPAYVPGASYTPGASAAPAAAYVPGASFVPGEMPAVSWEFQVKAGWEAFNGDCQQYIERCYQKFAARGGQDEFNVRTQGGGKAITITVNFRSMDQRMGEHGRRRTIRRQPPS